MPSYLMSCPGDGSLYNDNNGVCFSSYRENGEENYGSGKARYPFMSLVMYGNITVQRSQSCDHACTNYLTFAVLHL